jgi:hypothetical protein
MPNTHFKFTNGQWVKIVRLEDDQSDRNMIGHIGTVTNRQWQEFPECPSYEISCLCQRRHFMHETELELSPVRIRAMIAQPCRMAYRQEPQRHTPA